MVLLLIVLITKSLSLVVGCGCHLRHTTSEGCDVHGTCMCKENYDGKTCGKCKLGYVDFPTCRKLGNISRVVKVNLTSCVVASCVVLCSPLTSNF